MFLQQKTLKYVEKIQGTDRKICTSGSRGIRPLTIQPIFFQLIFGMLNFVADVESQKFWLKMFSLMIFVSTDLHWQWIQLPLHFYLEHSISFSLSLSFRSLFLFSFSFSPFCFSLSLAIPFSKINSLAISFAHSFLLFSFSLILYLLSRLSHLFLVVSPPFSLVFLSSQMQQISIMTKSFPVFMPFNVTNKFQLRVNEWMLDHQTFISFILSKIFLGEKEFVTSPMSEMTFLVVSQFSSRH